MDGDIPPCSIIKIIILIVKINSYPERSIQVKVRHSYCCNYNRKHLNKYHKSVFEIILEKLVLSFHVCSQFYKSPVDVDLQDEAHGHEHGPG